MFIKNLWNVLLVGLLALAGCQSTGGQSSTSMGGQSAGISAAEIDRNVDAALKKLYASTPAARELAQRANGILVFPSVIKAGFMGGAQYGSGALRKKGKTVAYYTTLGGSYGFQAGVQSFSYALFFMSDEALRYLDQSGGWEIGAGPSVVVVDEGTARAMTTTMAKDDVYAFIFGQKGLMAGAGLLGSKITRLYPD
ncbi:lipid-binding SYLF domain-containing protein [Nitrosospira sp. Is2]|uniref:lipid-binding SYLF domain-containing protein n=1 Tax=Nitrosospira sp. Is2 TaxID=3080532 RepID=UPI0029556C56|nr:lipid-binding SYLF domain-containing protein [Nitrosospira sp. Is2]WON74338.1 lipid-binding SYLF domain-containing protein [Nitrosospira sp. Is2]